MNDRFRFDLRSSERRVRRGVVLLAFLTFLSFSLLALFDARVLHWRLTRSAAERTATRLSTSPDLSSASAESLPDVWPDKTTIGDVDSVKRARDSILIASARQWLSEPSRRSETERRGDVLRGLARWDVEAESAAAFFEKPDDAALFSGVERNELIAQRVGATSASHDAAQAIAELAEDDSAPELADAVAFLRELGLDDVSAEETDGAALESAFLWTFATDARDPIDMAGYVVSGDFAPASEAVLAGRFCGATARLFLLLTLGVLPMAGVSHVMSVVLAFLSVIRVQRARVAAKANERQRACAADFCRRCDSLLLISTVRLLD